MTKLRNPEIQCGGKRAYFKRKTARHGLANARKRKPEDAHRLRVYRCPHCGYYHVGRTPQ